MYSMCLFPLLYFLLPCKVRELHTLKGKVESFAKLRGLDIDVVEAHFGEKRKGPMARKTVTI